MPPTLRLMGCWGDGRDRDEDQDRPSLKTHDSCDEHAILLAVWRALGRVIHMNNAPDQRGVSAPLVDDATSRGVAARAGVGVSIDTALAGWADELTARGCREQSAYRMGTLIRRVAKFAGWQGVAHVTYSDCVAFLANQRRGERPWAGPTYDQAVSTLRTFGEFCRRSGWTAANPLVDLQACGEPGEHGSRALTTAEARALIASSLERHFRSRRAKGYAPVFWLLMFHTGLRYAEAQGLRWKDLDLEGSIPALYTDPKAVGNKAKRRDRIPLHPELLEMLEGLRASSGNPDSNARVFRQSPNRATWRAEREAAKIPAKDARGRPVTPHSCRKSFCTWLDAQSIPRGLVSRLARHAHTLTEEKYIDHDSSLEVAAIHSLPTLWPQGVKIFARNLEKESCLNGNPCDTQGVKQCIPTKTSTMLPRPFACAASQQAVKGSGSVVAISAVSSGKTRAIESNNGQNRTENDSDLIVDALTRGVLALSRIVESRLGGSEEPAHVQRNQAG